MYIYSIDNWNNHRYMDKFWTDSVLRLELGIVSFERARSFSKTMRREVITNFQNCDQFSITISLHINDEANFSLFCMFTNVAINDLLTVIKCN